MATKRKRQRAKRLRLAEGIWQDAYGISVIVGTGAQREEPRFDLDSDLTELIAWRLRRQADLLDDAPLPLRKGTLAADVPRRLALIPEGPQRQNAEILLRHWVNARLGPDAQGRDRGTFGQTRRDKLRRDDFRAQLAKWASEGVAANTLNHRLRAIRSLYRELDGEDANNPTDKIKKFREPKAEPRDVPVPVIQRLIDNMPDRGRGIKGEKRSNVSLTKIRISVMAWTALPQMMLERLRERDVDFAGRQFYVRPRRKGHGVDGKWLPLIPPAVDALRDYAKHNLWEQSFSRDSMAACWQRTIKRTIEEAARRAQETGDSTEVDLLRKCIPEGCRPYDLRHAFLSQAYRDTGDLRAVAELAVHSPTSGLDMTRRYTEGAVPARVAAAIEKMSERWKSKLEVKTKSKRMAKVVSIKARSARRTHA